MASFEDVLPRLKGARLHVFIKVLCREAKVMLGVSAPLSLSSIQGIGYSRHTVIDALDFLVAERFLDELPGRAGTGEKLYRVCNYGWYGRERRGASAKTAPAPPGPSVDREGESAETALVQKKFPVVDALDRSSIEESIQKQQQQTFENCTFSDEEREQILDAFWNLGIGQNGHAELLELEHMSVDYALAWVEHKRVTRGRLGGGFYRMEMRAGHVSPVRAEIKERWSRRSDFSDAQWARMKPANRDMILEHERLEGDR